MMNASSVRYPTVHFPSQDAVMQTRKLRRWGFIRIHAALVIIAALSLMFLEPWLTVVVGGLLVLPVFLYIAVGEMRQAPLRLTPVSCFMLWNSVGLGTSAIYMGLRLRSGQWVNFSVAQVPPSDVAAGYVICLLSTLAVHVGLQLTRPDQRGDRMEPLRVASLHSLLLMWTLGVLYLFRPTWLASAGAILNPLQWAAVAALTMFLLSPPEACGFSFYGRLAIGMLGVVGTAVANLMTGSKAHFMYSFLPLFWLLVINPRLRKFIVVFSAALAIFYFAVVAPVFTDSRLRPMQEGTTAAAHIAQSFQSALVFASGPKLINSLTAQSEFFLTRLFESLPVGYIQGEIRKGGYKMGETLEYAKYAFIPRLLWPDKPNVSRGAWFTTYLGFAAREEEATSSTGMTSAGEWYWNFGIPGVVLGMLGVGILCGLLWRMAGANPVGDPLRMLIYVGVAVGAMTNMPEAITVYAGALSQLLIFGALLWALSAHRRSTPVRVRYGHYTEAGHTS